MPVYKITLKQTITRIAYGAVEAENEEQAKNEAMQNWSNYEDDFEEPESDGEIVKIEKSTNDMIKIFYGSDGRTVLAKAVDEISRNTNARFLFPEITTSANVGHSSTARRLDIAVPASPADIAQVVKELVQLESDTTATIYVATCSHQVINFIQEKCKECIIVEC